MQKHRIGILGCGVISRTYIADIQRFFPDLEIIACADIILDFAQKLADEFSIPRAYVTEELLEDSEVEIVVNLTPPQMHVELNRRIIEAGKHLFCEKSFASTLDQALDIFALAEKKHVKVGGAPDTFLASGLQSTRFYLDSGLIGKPFFVSANMMSSGIETWHPNPAPFYQKGAGPVMDMAPYYLAAIVSLLGPIESITAMCTQAFRTRYVYTGPKAGTTVPVETPTHYTALLRLVNGVIVSLNISFDIYRSNLPMFEIYGDEGTLCYPDPNYGGGTPRVYRKEQSTDTVYRSDAEAATRSERFYELPELFTRMKDYSRGLGIQDLAFAIENNTENRTGSGFLCHITEALEGLLKSGQTGRCYQMRTSCERPRPLKTGAMLTDLQ